MLKHIIDCDQSINEVAAIEYSNYSYGRMLLGGAHNAVQSWALPQLQIQSRQLENAADQI